MKVLLLASALALSGCTMQLRGDPQTAADLGDHLGRIQRLEQGSAAIANYLQQRAELEERRFKAIESLLPKPAEPKK